MESSKLRRRGGALSTLMVLVSKTWILVVAQSHNNAVRPPLSSRRLTACFTPAVWRRSWSAARHRRTLQSQKARHGGHQFNLSQPRTREGTFSQGVLDLWLWLDDYNGSNSDEDEQRRRLNMAYSSPIFGESDADLGMSSWNPPSSWGFSESLLAPAIEWQRPATLPNFPYPPSAWWTPGSVKPLQEEERNTNGTLKPSLTKSIRNFDENQDDDDELDDDEGGDNVDQPSSIKSRVVATASRWLSLSSARQSVKNRAATGSPNLLDQIDAIFHAASYSTSSDLLASSTASNVAASADSVQTLENGYGNNAVVNLLKSSLEDAGFRPLKRRDLDLCEALNAGYLLRLSLLPNLSQLDPKIAAEFDSNLKDALFEGRVMVYWRGYSEEVTTGRLLLRKLDYLQASLVQRTAAAVTRRVGRLERALLSRVSTAAASLRESVARTARKMPAYVSLRKASDSARAAVTGQTQPAKDCDVDEFLFSSDAEDDCAALFDEKKIDTKWWNGAAGGANLEDAEGKVLKLYRYGGSKTRFVGAPDWNDALKPFLLWNQNDETLDDNVVDHSTTLCLYDEQMAQASPSSVNVTSNSWQILRRISISDIVDFFSTAGRRRLLPSFVAKSELVEPTYDEVVVIWRQLEPTTTKKKRNPFQLPPRFVKFVYGLAEIFEVEDRLPSRLQPLGGKRSSKSLKADDNESADKSEKDTSPPLQIRSFRGVPMANLPAVLPQTKLIFRPADAFVFDLVSILSLVFVIGSQRFDNPKLDAIALVSVCLWGIRTFLRYSNKLARYDLLVNKFLTSKIFHRGSGAVRYLAMEAGSQRAAHAALLHTWLVRRWNDNDESQRSSGPWDTPDTSLFSRTAIAQDALAGMNEVLRQGEAGGEYKEEENEDEDVSSDVDMNVEAAMDDLERLGLVRWSSDGKEIVSLKQGDVAAEALQSIWNNVF